MALLSSSILPLRFQETSGVRNLTQVTLGQVLFYTVPSELPNSWRDEPSHRGIPNQNAPFFGAALCLGDSQGLRQVQAEEGSGTSSFCHCQPQWAPPTPARTCEAGTEQERHPCSGTTFLGEQVQSPPLSQGSGRNTTGIYLQSASLRT